MQKNKIEVTFYKSKSVGGFIEHLNSILEQFAKLTANKIPVKLTFFTTSINQMDYEFEFNLIQQNAIKYNVLAPIALISQFPAENKALTLEVITFENVDRKVEIIRNNGSLLLKCIDQELLFASVNSYQGKTFQENVEIAFQNLNIILDHFKFKYSDVLRQWNYIEDIIHLAAENDTIKQNYQTFNDCRSLQYSTSNFISGYPVATGIGTSCGGCCVEIIAIKGTGIDLVPIHNTRQIDAHCYTEHVLVGNQTFEHKPISTPKFERAKVVTNSTIQMLLVSGTASIIGEKTICKGDIAGQTQTTIDNIKILLDTAIAKASCKSYNLLNYRAYVKNISDTDIVKQICDRSYEPNVGIVLISDICRDDLLVEIECNYILEF